MCFLCRRFLVSEPKGTALPHRQVSMKLTQRAFRIGTCVNRLLRSAKAVRMGAAHLRHTHRALIDHFRCRRRRRSHRLADVLYVSALPHRPALTHVGRAPGTPRHPWPSFSLSFFELKRRWARRGQKSPGVRRVFSPSGICPSLCRCTTAYPWRSAGSSPIPSYLGGVHRGDAASPIKL